MRWPKGTRISIDSVESNSPLVRIVRDEEWEMLMDELRYLRGERTDVVAHLRERAIHGSGNTITVEDACTILADLFERGDHRRGEEHGH